MGWRLVPEHRTLFDGGFFKLTFAKAGTYTYKCLIHDGMEGTVKVGS